ncbi:uncharacterized protein PFL1_04244 [Pseudozyma flocculosa PF-1]|uniref:Related to multidrug resistance protein 1 n=2 Tax=Pseudozyma flocculosa TaxID=84751 RepID=A0A5C3EVR4_9BASI|nr:uncharacterized protein PFL1_04244 [Pseudozyma flocculosa PF-1]EPQ28417.1 hypothetical protein PFL1_04244 [Pseudozyma flocculosa PF-1]SPO35587.1 related to multidrug resistance protein 1 [Pseudozyma flocculosa]
MSSAMMTISDPAAAAAKPATTAADPTNEVSHPQHLDSVATIQAGQSQQHRPDAPQGSSDAAPLDAPSHSPETTSSAAHHDAKQPISTMIRATTTSRTVHVAPLRSHSSRLPDFLYLLSFCPPLPSPISQPRAFCAHPGVLYFVGLLSALIAGLGMPSLDLLYGIYTNRITPADATSQDIVDGGSFVGWVITVCGIGELIFAWLFLACFSSASHSLTQRLRHAYVASVLSQDASHFDLHGAGEIANRAGKDISSVRTGFGEKLGFATWSLATLFASVIIGFVKAPRIAGVLLALLPLTMIIFTVLAKATERVGAPALRIEGRASTFLEQVLGSVRVVQSFGMESALIARFESAMLAPLEKLGMRKAGIRGIEMGAVYTMLNLTYSLAFWWGSINLAQDKVSLGNLLTAFWNYLNSLFALSNMVPHIAAIFDSWTAIKQVRLAIERVPKIDIRDQGGLQLPADNSWQPSFEIRGVTFAYPSRPNVASLRDVSLVFEAGKVTALVGPSGSGKSTITGLLLREYDPETANVPHPDDEKVAAEEKKDQEAQDKAEAKMKRKQAQRDGIAKVVAAKDLDAEEKGVEADKAEAHAAMIQGAGEVLFAGRDIRDYNLAWLRSQVAIVQQHPQLFTASIFENVAAGLTGTEWAYSPDVDGDPHAPEHIKSRTALIRAKVQDALEKAQAWGFVQKLPEGMDTVVSGGRTGLLSGGQRQRVAIARALVRQPRVLCLDEGTSALDSDTEARIKVALQREQDERGMTTILIAHRLSTIEHADLIVTMKKGQVVEQGTHDQLMNVGKGRPCLYRDMVMQQKHFAEYEGDGSDDDDGDDFKKSGLGQASKNDASTPSALSSPFATSSSAASSPKAIEDTQGPGREYTSDASTTQVGGAWTDGTPSVSAPQRPLDPPQPSRPTGPMRQRTSRASEHHWQVPGRTTGHTVGQLEHSADAPAASEEIPPAAAMLLDKEAGLDGSDSAGKGSPPSVDGSGSVDGARAKEVQRSQTRKARSAFFRYVWSQRVFFAIGILGAIATGGSFPVAGWLTGKAVNSLSIQGDDARLRREANYWAQWFLVLAMADLVIVLVNSFFLEVASEHVIRKLKRDGLAALIRQEIGFFDSEDHASGTMSSAVSSHPANVGAATGLIFSQVIISTANLIGSIVMGLALSWKAALVCLAPIVVLFVSGYLNIVMLERYEATSQKSVDKAASYIAENVDAIKTVAALGREGETMRVFDERAKADPRRTRYLIFGAGGFAVSQAMVLLLSALIFWWGAVLLSKSDLGLTELYAVFEAVIIAAFSAGRLFTFVPDYGRAKNSFRTIHGWLSRKPRVATLQPVGGAAVDRDVAARAAEGDILLTDIELRYPQRPHHPALKHLSLRIKAGQSVAFCGTSGSGKSSLLSLLQRFYDPSRGTITFGGTDVRSIPLDDLRSQMAYVSQDPILYEGSIRWNLCLGSLDPQSVTQAQLEDACQKACILDFILGLPGGFDAEVGFKGSQLSGGQKQRLCIARALLRNPKILLLDEATSALDAEAEGAVQSALDNAAKGRTTITVAHRLSSLRKCDWIFVVEDGKIREQGNHHDLLARGGRYKELMEAQL